MPANQRLPETSIEDGSHRDDGEESGVRRMAPISAANDVEPTEALRRSARRAQRDPDDFSDLWPRPEIVQAWRERHDRRGAVQAAGRIAILAAVGGLLAIAAPRAGSDSIASWLTMGHAAEVRDQVARVLDPTAAPCAICVR